MLKNKIKELALKLHSFPEKDRAWILGNLNDVERNKIEVLLLEIDSINIFGNQEIASEALNSFREIYGEDDNNNNSSDLNLIIKSLNSKSAEVMINTLKDIEPSIIALILEFHNWKWKEQFKDQLNMTTKVLVSKRKTKDMVGIKESVKYSILGSVNDALLKSENNIRNKDKQKLQLFFEPKSLSENV